jgi:hypothetical protein
MTNIELAEYHYQLGRAAILKIFELLGTRRATSKNFPFNTDGS